MSYGLQISASGVMTAMYRQDVFASNLANMDTVGFKPDSPQQVFRLDVRREDGVANLPSNALLEKLGGGVLINPNRISFRQGALRSTGNALDVAIQGDGFLAVRDVADTGGDRLRFSRDGRLTLDRSGTLVMASNGMPVLDTQGQPIRLDPRATVAIDGDGSVRQGGELVARLQLVDFDDRSGLSKAGHGLFTASTDTLATRTPATGTVRQFHVEESAVDEVRALLQMTSAAREVDANVALIQQHDRLMERAIASLGRTT